MSAVAAALRIDPFRGFNFLVRLIDTSTALTSVVSAIATATQGGFSECSGLEMSLDIEEYREGGNNGTVLVFPSRIKRPHLRLKRGMALSDDLWLWHYAFVQGKVQRRDGLIALQDEEHNPVKIWKFTRGLAVKWTGPNLNASQNQVAVEELEIAHEGLDLL